MSGEPCKKKFDLVHRAKRNSSVFLDRSGEILRSQTEMLEASMMKKFANNVKRSKLTLGLRSECILTNKRLIIRMIENSIITRPLRVLNVISIPTMLRI